MALGFQAFIVLRGLGFGVIGPYGSSGVRWFRALGL